MHFIHVIIQATVLLKGSSLVSGEKLNVIIDNLFQSISKVALKPFVVVCFWPVVEVTIVLDFKPLCCSIDALFIHSSLK